MPDTDQMEALGKLVKDGATKVAEQVAESTAEGIAKQVAEITARATAAEVGAELRKAFSTEVAGYVDRIVKAEMRVTNAETALEAANVGRARAEYDAAVRVTAATEHTQLSLTKAITESDGRMEANEARFVKAVEVVKQRQADLDACIENLAGETEGLARTASEEAVAKLANAAQATVAATMKSALATIHSAMTKISVSEADRKRVLDDSLGRLEDAVAYARKSSAASRAHMTKILPKMEAAVVDIKQEAADLFAIIAKEMREDYVRVSKELYSGPDERESSAQPPLTWEGPWSTERAYDVGGLSMYQGSTWVAMQANTGVAPSIMEGSPWGLFAAAGMGGGFSSQGDFKRGDTDDPPDLNLYGKRGGTSLGWYRAERLILDWLPGTFYYAADKVIVETLTGELQIWDRVSAGISRPVWDTQEESRWRMVAGTAAPILYGDTAPTPELNKFWLETDTWQLHVGYTDDLGGTIWVEVGLHGSRTTTGLGDGGVLPGGDTGDILMKLSNIDGDAGWRNLIDSGIFV